MKRQPGEKGRLTSIDILSDTEGERVIGYFLEARKNEVPPPNWVMDFLEVAFTKILDGEDVRGSMQLMKPRGRKSGPADSQYEAITARFIELRSSGGSYDANILDCRKKFECSKNTVERALRAHLKVFESAIRSAEKGPIGAAIRAAEKGPIGAAKMASRVAQSLPPKKK